MKWASRNRSGDQFKTSALAARKLRQELSRDGDADFVFLARDTALAAPESDRGGSPYIDNRPLLVATKPDLREYKAVYVQSDAEIGLFSDEVVVNCAP